MPEVSAEQYSSEVASVWNGLVFGIVRPVGVDRDLHTP
ncbi:Uncharacterised protein [Mycobacteroides abscessus subsp. bolletii]|nr:Uncharacterised protein [Mycobacteroides abscessus subsp. bolletii]SHS08524.1 Uncharacterised protein [Mycobacteroides abscessus subsp. bolletii]SHS82539.1 Uncharacterised protein [Mycobacteroides abscessus subsp. bolletii]SHS86393.1 Uncharacterised protein [Mycobacteroides abscessus subsp. bolletii]SHX72237.1 Uncharacterised protein [Mycobacteroides abscessus subsp. bolletii]